MSMSGCFLSKKNHEVHGVIEIISDYKIENQNRNILRKDSSELFVEVYDKYLDQPISYAIVEVCRDTDGITSDAGFTRDNGIYETILPKGIYNIEISNGSSFQINNVKCINGQTIKIRCNLGTTIMY